MTLVAGILEYGIKYVLFIGIALAGIAVGKKLKDNKMAKMKK